MYFDWMLQAYGEAQLLATDFHMSFSCSPRKIEQLQHHHENKDRIRGDAALKPRISLLKVSDIETEATPSPGNNYGKISKPRSCFWKVPQSERTGWPAGWPLPNGLTLKNPDFITWKTAPFSPLLHKKCIHLSNRTSHVHVFYLHSVLGHTPNYRRDPGHCSVDLKSRVVASISSCYRLWQLASVCLCGPAVGLSGSIQSQKQCFHLSSCRSHVHVLYLPLLFWHPTN